MLADDSIAQVKTIDSRVGAHLLVVESSQIMKAPADADQQDTERLLATAGDRGSAGSRNPHSLPTVAPQSISLNVSSSCNLGCHYCYAARGNFQGAQQKPMDWLTARAAIDRLLSGCDSDSPVTIGFLGGEPFANTKLIHRAVRYSSARGRGLGLDVRFSVTTNGTLLSDDDIEMLRRYPFAVTISVDGGREIYQRQRVGASFEQLQTSIRPLLLSPGKAKISARATISRDVFDLVQRFDDIQELGFDDIGFSPLRVSPDDNALRDQDWTRCLEEYCELGRRELEALRRGRTSAFSNLMVALKQIDRGACSPYPCGAGGGYFSVAVDGTWYACHRAIGDEVYSLGDSRGLDDAKRLSFLVDRHVDRQTDCRRCWARYLCSGSCHQEAKARTPASCDFIRGWLDFCLAAYCELNHSEEPRLT